MNLYFLVEGKRTEAKVYSAWIPLVFPGMVRVFRPEDLQGNHFLVFSLNGYPFNRDKLKLALQDQAAYPIDYLFICADAEEESFETRFNAIERVISEIVQEIYRTGAGSLHALNPFIIVQNRCIETWFLGNRRFMKRQPNTEQLRHCLKHYSVLENDPEQMPIPDGFTGTHAHCHIAYLKAMFDEHGLPYTKINPGAVKEASYLAELARRCDETDPSHLPSLKRLLEAWRSLGGKIPSQA